MHRTVSKQTLELESYEQSKYDLIQLIKKLLSQRLIPTLFSGFETLSLYTVKQTDLQMFTQMNYQHLNKLMILYLKNESARKLYFGVQNYLIKNATTLRQTEFFIPLAVMLKSLYNDCIYKKTTEIQIISNCEDCQVKNFNNVSFIHDFESRNCQQKIKRLIGKHEVTVLEQEPQQNKMSFTGMTVIRVSENFEFQSSDIDSSPQNLTEVLDQAIQTQLLRIQEFSKRFDVIVSQKVIDKTPSLEISQHLSRMRQFFNQFNDFQNLHKFSTTMFQFDLQSEELKLKSVIEKSEYLSSYSKQDQLLNEIDARNFALQFQKNQSHCSSKVQAKHRSYSLTKEGIKSETSNSLIQQQIGKFQNPKLSQYCDIDKNLLLNINYFGCQTQQNQKKELERSVLVRCNTKEGGLDLKDSVSQNNCMNFKSNQACTQNLESIPLVQSMILQQYDTTQSLILEMEVDSSIQKIKYLPLSEPKQDFSMQESNLSDSEVPIILDSETLISFKIVNLEDLEKTHLKAATIKSVNLKDYQEDNYELPKPLISPKIQVKSKSEIINSQQTQRKQELLESLDIIGKPKHHEQFMMNESLPKNIRDENHKLSCINSIEKGANDKIINNCSQNRKSFSGEVINANLSQDQTNSPANQVPTIKNKISLCAQSQSKQQRVIPEIVSNPKSSAGHDKLISDKFNDFSAYEVPSQLNMEFYSAQQPEQHNYDSSCYQVQQENNLNSTQGSFVHQFDLRGREVSLLSGASLFDYQLNDGERNCEKVPSWEMADSLFSFISTIFDYFTD
eukprot:403373544